MGLLRALRLVRAAADKGKASPAALESTRPSASFALDVPQEITGLPSAGGVAPRINRREALQVPAVLRARNLICSSISTLPIRVHGPDRRVVEGTQYLVPNPDPDIPASVMLAQTIEDLVFEGIAWWQVTRFGWHGYPIEARHVPVDRVTIQAASGVGWSGLRDLIGPDQPYPVDGQVFIDGIPVPDREVIRFDSPNPPLLEHAARAIRTCLLLDQTAALYAKDPLPLGYFADQSPDTTLNDDEVKDLLDGWESARQKRAWGYAGGLKPEVLQWSPEQLQLADARQHAVLEIARATGIDPEDLGVSTTSRTYQNGETRRQALLDFTLAPYVSAIEGRLSMRDVLPRGYEAKIDFGGFLRSDTKTRMETYKIGLEVGAYTREEIRELEDRPPLTPNQQRQIRPQPPAAAPPTASTERAEEAAMSRTDGYDFTAAFHDDREPVQVSFGNSATVAASFRVDPDKRTISGLLMPWGDIAESGMRRYKFAKESLYWSDVSRIKLFRDHDYDRPVGVAVRLQNTDQGLDATWRVARGSGGDEVLRLAEDQVLDGLSAGVDFGVDDEWQPDPSDESVRLVRRARLREGSITALPAFDSARVTSVTASQNTPKGNDTMSDNSTEATAAEGQAPAAAPDLAQFTTGVSEALTKAVEETFARLPIPQHDIDDKRPVRAGRVQVVSEPPVYSFSGHGPSLVRDAWHARVEGNGDARDRLRKFYAQQQEVVGKFQARPDLAFVVGTGGGTTEDASGAVPPGYRPDLYVTQLIQGRPLVDAVSRGALTDATPFVLPVFGGSSGASADHTEGVNPSGGSLTIDTKTVTPGGISGKYELTREIIDSSNPAIDQIAFTSMRESYAQQTEAKVYAELNGTNGQGGTITNGFVPSGAQVLQEGVTATPSDAASLVASVRSQLALYSFRRFAPPNRMHLSQEATSAFASAVGSDGRPLLPSVGAQNTSGLGNAVEQGWFVDGLAARPTWSISGSADGDADVFFYNALDVWAWESPLLTFRFEEKSGPAIVELALFGYFATRLIRPVGLSAIRYVD